MTNRGKILVSVLLIAFVSLKANAQLMYSPMNYPYFNSFSRYNNLGDTNLAKKKWSLNKYAGLSTGFSTFRGGSASYFSAPVGLQLTRQLNNNLYAFAGVSVAPTYMNFSNSFMNANISKMNPANLSMYSRIEGGLMYINDQKTFSISGSISVDRNSYPVYPYYNRNMPKQPVQNAPLK